MTPEFAIDHHKRIEEELRELRELLSVAQVVVSSLDLDEVLQDILASAMAITETPAGSIALYDEQSSRVHLRVHAGLSDRLTEKKKWLVKPGGLTHHLLEEGELFIVEDTEKADFFNNPLAVEEGIRSLIAVPLKIQNHIVGMLYVDDFKPRTYPEHRLRVLKILSSFASLSINNAQLHAEAQKLACTDGLTGLYNHRQFKAMLREEMARSRRYDKKMALIMLDIDDFKRFNDTYGHPEGDKVLASIGTILRATLRDSDISFRYGGEEFVALLPETGITAATQAADRIGEAVRTATQRLLTNIHPQGMTMSMGVAAFPRDGEDEETLLKVADDMLYRAKSLGKNRACSRKSSE